MKCNPQIKKKITQLLPYVEIVVGIIFLCFEIRDYMTLYSMAEADKLFGGLVDFFKYKESTYSQFFFWGTVTLTGISYWVNKKLYWVLTQNTIFILFSKLGLPYILIYLAPVTVYIVPLIYLALFIWLQIKLSKINKIGTTVVDKQTKTVGIISGVLSWFIYTALFL